mmetsp:Transcript_32790/g.78058  ORF Transcript_32790/g.78058 Transcript_32790/m.78058 type:complete len:256 (+) Transcript_32790:744-1511(+)
MRGERVLGDCARDAKCRCELLPAPGIPMRTAAPTPEGQTKLPTLGRQREAGCRLAVGLTCRVDVILHAVWERHNLACAGTEHESVGGIAAVLPEVQPVSACPTTAVLLSDPSQHVQPHDACRAVGVGAALVTRGRRGEVGVSRDTRSGAEPTLNKTPFITQQTVRVRCLLGALLRPAEIWAESVDGEPIVGIIVLEPNVPLVLHSHIATILSDILQLARVGCNSQVEGHEGSKVHVSDEATGGGEEAAGVENGES